MGGRATVTLMYDDGATQGRSYELLPLSRTNIPIATDFAQAQGRAFGVLVEAAPAAGATAVPQLIVERAVYYDSGAVRWAAGTDALAAPLDEIGAPFSSHTPEFEQFGVMPSSAPSGTPVKLIWRATQASHVTISSVDGVLPPSGEMSFPLLKSQVFEAVASGPGGTNRAVATANVQAVPPAASAEVGAAGGIVQVTDSQSPLAGLRISIPAGALDTATTISIVPDAGLAIPTDSTRESTVRLPAFRLTPEGLKFKAPVALEIPFRDDDEDGIVDGSVMPVESGHVFRLDETRAEWIRQEAIIDRSAHRLVAMIDHFSPWSAEFRSFGIDRISYYVDDSLYEKLEISRTAANGDIRRAFDAWSGALDGRLVFEQTNLRQNADVILRGADLCSPLVFFGLECGSMALTSTRAQPLSTSARFTVTYNASRKWHADYPASYQTYTVEYGLPFLRVTLHELGHVIGLPEYTDKRTYEPSNKPPYGVYPTSGYPVMYYEELTKAPLTVLAPFDRGEVRRVYGLSGDCEPFSVGPVTFEAYPDATISPPPHRIVVDYGIPSPLVEMGLTFDSLGRPEGRQALYVGPNGLDGSKALNWNSFSSYVGEPVISVNQPATEISVDVKYLADGVVDPSARIRASFFREGQRVPDSRITPTLLSTGTLLQRGNGRLTFVSEGAFDTVVLTSVVAGPIGYAPGFSIDNVTLRCR